MLGTRAHGPSARLASHLLQSRHQAGVRKARTTAVRLCVAFVTDDDPCNEGSDYIGEKWIADSGASFHMTNSADLLSGARLGDDKVRVGDNHLIDVVGYEKLTVVLPGDLTVKLLDVA